MKIARAEKVPLAQLAPSYSALEIVAGQGAQLGHKIHAQSDRNGSAISAWRFTRFSRVAGCINISQRSTSRRPWPADECDAPDA